MRRRGALSELEVPAIAKLALTVWYGWRLKVCQMPNFAL